MPLYYNKNMLIPMSDSAPPPIISYISLLSQYVKENFLSVSVLWHSPTNDNTLKRTRTKELAFRNTLSWKQTLLYSEISLCILQVTYKYIDSENVMQKLCQFNVY